MRYRIRPFKKDGVWMFTDIGVTVENESLVQGIDATIEELTASIPEAERRFEMIVADEPFDGAQVYLEWIRAGRMAMSALGIYFSDPPTRLYIQATFLRNP